MFGGGSPIAVHSNVIPGPPSTAVWLSLTRSNSGESVEKEIHIIVIEILLDINKQTVRQKYTQRALTQGSVEKKLHSGKKQIPLSLNPY